MCRRLPNIILLARKVSENDATLEATDKASNLSAQDRDYRLMGVGRCECAPLKYFVYILKEG